METEDIINQVVTLGNNVTALKFPYASFAENCKIKKLTFQLREDSVDHDQILTYLIPSVRNLSDLEILVIDFGNDMTFNKKYVEQYILAFSHSINQLTNLKIFDLSLGYLEGKRAKLLAPLFTKLNNLQSLNLNIDEISAKGIKILSESLEELNSLKSLNLRFGTIKIEGIEFFTKSLSKLTNLENLDFYSCRSLGEQGYKAFARAIEKLSKLVILDLETGRDITDRSNVLSSLSEGSPNLIFLNKEKTKNYEVAKKLAEEINSSGMIANPSEAFKYSAAVKYFLRKEFEREDLLSWIDDLLSLEDYSHNQIELVSLGSNQVAQTPVEE